MTVSKAELKKIKVLGSKKGRREQNRFAVGGVRLLEEAVGADNSPVAVYYSKSGVTDKIEKLIGNFSKLGIEIISVSNKEMEQISDTETPQGVMAVFNIPEVKLSKLYKPAYRRLLLCDKISDPGNLGTLARSAFAFGFELIMATESTTEIYSPKAVRSSAGALFKLPAANVSLEDITSLKTGHNAHLAAAVANSANNAKSIDEVSESLQNKNTFILAIGGEAEGLSHDIIKLADSFISISHNSNVESLNAAVAGSILMNEIYKRDTSK